MSYVEENLVPGEVVLHFTGVSLWAYLQYVLASLALMAIAWYLWAHYDIPIMFPLTLAGVAIGVTSVSKILRDANELAVTNERVIIKVGWLWVKSAVLYLNRVEGVEVNQSIIGRILNFGSVRVRGVGTELFEVHYVLGPREFRREVFTAASEQSRGVGAAPGAMPPAHMAHADV